MAEGLEFGDELHQVSAGLGRRESQSERLMTSIPAPLSPDLGRLKYYTIRVGTATRAEARSQRTSGRFAVSQIASHGASSRIGSGSGVETLL